MKLNVKFLDKLTDVELETKNLKKNCLIEDIINEFPEGEYRDRVIEIIENKDGYTGIAVVKILRQTGITEGSDSSILKHRRKCCACYL